MAEPAPRDPLEELRERLQAAERSARRLVAELPATGGGDADGGDRERATQETQALASLLATLRALVPPELQDQLRDLARQLLLLLRALIDRSLDGLQERPDDGPVVQDIEIS